MEAGKIARDEAAANATAESKAANDKSLTELKAEWGDGFDDKVAKAALAYEQFGKDPSARTKVFYQMWLDKLSEDVLVQSQGRAAESVTDFLDPSSYPKS